MAARPWSRRRVAPVTSAPLPQDVPRPPLCDWAWRPGPWQAAIAPPSGPLASGAALSEAVNIFHDDPEGDVAVSQDGQGTDGASYAICVNVGRFTGSFVSLSIDLPTDGVVSLSPDGIVAARAVLDGPPLGAVFLRLNMQIGPNVDPVAGSSVPDGVGGAVIEADFDLGFRNIQAGRVTKAWLDVILDHPVERSMTFRDLTLTRRPRARF